jgi:hypothetical protein
MLSTYLPFDRLALIHHARSVTLSGSLQTDIDITEWGERVKSLSPKLKDMDAEKVMESFSADLLVDYRQSRYWGPDAIPIRLINKSSLLERCCPVYYSRTYSGSMQGERYRITRS